MVAPAARCRYRRRTVILYTCGQKGSFAIAHPCGVAKKALDDAGLDYELKTVDGYRLLPWTRRGSARDEIERLSGQRNVPILVVDDDTVISGSGSIARWAKAAS